MPIVTELMSVRQIDLFLEAGVDVIQVGARNMQNFDLLREPWPLENTDSAQARPFRHD